MADINSNINLNIDTQEALANIKNLQRQISVFHQQMLRSGNAVNESISRNLQSVLMKNLDASGKFRTQIKTIQSETEMFTENLEKNKFSIGQYFRYAGASTKTFGKLWKKEFNTIEKVATERVKTLQTQYIKLGRDANGALKAIQVRPLALDMDNLATKTALAAQKQILLNQLLKQGSTALLNFGKNTQWAGRQLMVGFTIPLTMAGSAAAKAYMDIEKAAVKFKRVYGDLNTGNDAAEKMLSNIKNLAMEYTKYGVAFKDTIEMAATAAATGKQGAELLAQVNQASKLSVLGQVDAQQALETTISLTNAFRTSTEDLAESVDFLNAVENQTSTSIEDLTIAIPKAAPVIQQLGGDVKDLAFFLTAMKEGGINASEGANALKSGLASMINPTKQAKEVLTGYGISIQGIVDNNEGNVKGMITGLATELDKLRPLERAKAIETLFGKFQFARMSTLFQNVIAEGSQAKQVLSLTKATAEELQVLSQRELRKVEDSPAFKFQKVLEQLQAKLAPLGEAFLKAITPVAEWVTKLLDGFNKMSAGAKQFATIATLAIAGLGPIILMTVGLIANGVANLIKFFTGIKNFINKTTDGTAELGDTTDYMTQKQLEAEAVAMSLDQAHAKLRENFLLEAEAIKALTTEYERAITAQAQYATNAGLDSSGTPAPGFAGGGVISGPGTGTSDSIPAMLSDGEAVIPAAVVRKNPQLIQALINGKIKGFAKGGIAGTITSAAGSMEVPVRTQTVADSLQRLVTAAETGSMGIENGSEVSANALQRIAKIIEEVGVVSLKDIGLSFQAASEQVNGLAIGISTLNKAVAGENKEKKTWAQSADVGSLQKQTEKSGNPKYIEEYERAVKVSEAVRAKAQELGMTQGQVTDRAQIDRAHAIPVSQADKMTNAAWELTGVVPQAHVDNEISKQLGADDSQKNQKLYDRYLEGLEAQSISEKEKASMLEKINSDIALTEEQLHIQRQILSEMLADSEFLAAGFNDKTSRLKFEQNAQLAIAADDARVAMGAPVNEGAGSRTLEEQAAFTGGIKAERAPYELAVKQSTEAGAATGDGYVKGVKESLDINSPSKKTYELGQQTGQGYVDGLKSTIPGVPAPGSVPPPPFTGNIPGVPAPSGIPQPVDSGKAGWLDTAKAKFTSATDAAADLAKKGLDKVSSGLKEGGKKVYAAADKKFGEYMQAAYDEADANSALSKKRMGLAHEALALTNTEYQNLQAVLDNHKAKMNANQAVTDEEIQAAADAMGAQKQMASAIAKQMENNGADLESVKQRIEIEKQRQEAIGAQNSNNDTAASGSGGAGDGGATLDSLTGGSGDDAAGEKTDKQKAKDAKKAKFNKTKGKLTKGLMVASGVAAAASALPGDIGKVAQFATGPLTAATTAMSMIPGPAGLVAGGLAAVAVSGIQLNNMLNDAAKKAQELTEALGTGNKAIGKFAEFTKKATASEVMNQKRQNRFGMFSVKPGKTTFGESYIKSESGQALMKSIGDQIAKGGSGSAEMAMTNQLSAAIASGALTQKQAQSVASQIGQELGDLTFGMNVNANIMNMFGADGKNLKDNPAEINVQISKQSLDGVKKSMTKLQDAGNVLKQFDAGKIFEAGARLGPVGLVAGIGPMMALGETIRQSWNYMENLRSSALQFTAQGLAALETQQQMLDSLDLEYDKRIAIAEAAGETEKITRLQVERDEAQLDIVNTMNETRQLTIKGVNEGDAGSLLNNPFVKGLGLSALGIDLDFSTRQATKDRLDTGIRETYKGRELEADAAIAKINTLGDWGTEAVLKQAVQNKTIGLSEITAAIDQFNGDKEELVGAIEDVGGEANFNDMMQLAGLFQTAEKKTAFIADMRTQGPIEAQNTMEALIEIQKAAGAFKNPEIAVDMIMDFYYKNPTRANYIQDGIEDLKKEPTITQTIITEHMGADVMNQIKSDQAYFDKLNKDQKVVYTQETAVLMSLVGTPEFDQNVADWIASSDAEGYPHSSTGYIQWLSRRIVETQPELVDDGDGGDGGAGDGPEASWLDAYVKRVRDAINWTQKLTVGFDASHKALKDFANNGFAKTIGGLKQMIAAAGANESLTDTILGLSDEDYQEFLSKMYNVKNAFANFVKTVNQTVIAENIGDFRVQMFQSVDALDAMGKGVYNLKQLAKDGVVPLTQAYELMADKELQAAYAAEKDGNMRKKLIQNYVMQKKAAWLTLSPAEKAQKYIDMYQANLEVISIKEDEINRKYDKRNEALDKIQAANENIKAQNQAQLNLAEALSKGDLSAALRASAEAEAVAAQQAVQARKDAMDKARQEELANVEVKINGKTMGREEIEAAIREHNEKITLAKKDQYDWEVKIGEQAGRNKTAVLKYINDLKKANVAAMKAVAAAAKAGKVDPGGDPGGDPGEDPGGDPPPPPPPPVAAAGSAASIQAGKAGKAATIKAVSGLTSGATAKTVVAAQSKKLSAAKQSLKNFKIGDKTYDMTKVSNRRFATSAADIAKLEELDSSVKSATASLKARGVNYDAATDTYTGTFGSKLGTAEEIASMTNAEAASSLYLGNQADINATIAKLPIEAQWLRTEAIASKFKEDFDNYTDKSRGGAQRRLKLAFEKSTLFKASDDLAGILANPTSAASFRKSYQEANQMDGSWADKDAKLVKGINDKWVKAKKMREALKSMGYKTADLTGILGNDWDKQPKEVTLINDGKGYSVNQIDKIGGAQRYAKGGMVAPARFFEGGFAVGTDTVPAMLTPGEFIVSQPAVKSFGLDGLKAINNGTYGGESVYNYSINVSVQSGANPDEIARAVMTQIQSVDSQRVRGNRF